MTQPEVRPHGSWRSPISSDLIVGGVIGLQSTALDNGDVYWLESRPGEGGRSVIVRRSPDGATEDLNPPPFNARTRVHEYGGGDFAAHNGTIYFANFEDQKLYVQPPGGGPEPLTHDGSHRFADMAVDPHRNRLVVVREDHSEAGTEPRNEISAVDLETGRERVLVTGSDFFSSPRLSPDGGRLAWLAWNHPNMPWDGTELWVADLDEDGLTVDATKVAGGVDESVFQPEWSPRGVLHFVSDRTGWWNLYRQTGDGIQPLCEREAEFGVPQWGFGMSTYAFLSPDRILCTYIERGVCHLAILDLETGTLEPVDTPYSSIGYIKADEATGSVFFLAGSPTEPLSVVRLDPETGGHAVLRRSSDLGIDESYLSIPEPIEFPTEGNLTAHAFFYAPRNRDHAAPDGEKPPLLVMSHGGPTAMTGATFSPGIQYWTSRGIAVLDVNYGGSTGFGREYRQRLYGEWGVVDVDDCANGALHLAKRGLVDGDRLAITGGSAGGYTTLCALTFRDDFAAGASHYGVSDTETLAQETHKFESRYLDGLIGPYPEMADLYRERSPIYYAGRLSCPVIFFQGLEDEVVPPNQAETMFEALKEKGVPVAYLPFEGEQHGFRKSENIKRALDGELYFYSRVFGFALADEIDPVPIENL